MDIDKEVKKSQDDFIESLRNLENNNKEEVDNNFKKNICIFCALFIIIDILVFIFIYNI